jgi:hypothetical protein
MPPLDQRYLFVGTSLGVLFPKAMTALDSPQRPERRDIRYPLHLPVSLTLAHKELHARSENISLGGILVSSTFLIPEGSTVEVAFGVAHLPQPSTQSSARGKVLRVQPKGAGDFAVAIAFEHPFRAGVEGLDSGSNSKGDGSRLPQKTKRIVTSRGLHLAWAWHTET